MQQKVAQNDGLGLLLKTACHASQKKLVAPEKSKIAENTRFHTFLDRFNTFLPILDVDGPILRVFTLF